MHDIAIIVVSWNACKDLRRCLSSFFSSGNPTVGFAVWVIDNGSSDGSPDMVAAEFPQVNLVRNPDNRGFSRANNQGIWTALHEKYRYVYLINSDAFIDDPTMLDGVVDFGDHNPAAGIIGTKVLNLDGTLQMSCRRWITFGAAIFRNTLMGRLFPNNKYARQYLMEDTAHNRARAVDWVSGCSMVIRMELIDKIGALDERFFMYCEDVDICRRTWNAGCEVWYFPDTIVTHRIGASSDKNAEKMIWEHHRSWAIYDAKYNPGFRPLRRAAVESGLWLRSAVRIVNRKRHDRRKR